MEEQTDLKIAIGNAFISVRCFLKENYNGKTLEVSVVPKKL